MKQSKIIVIAPEGKNNADSENLSAKAMDRLDNLASWHLAMSVSMDAAF
ncbi:MAG: hypothetical protein ACLPID_02505 [Beijerinckiaceae bacterium]